jgi:hypothetical protein
VLPHFVARHRKNIVARAAAIGIAGIAIVSLVTPDLRDRSDRRAIQYRLLHGAPRLFACRVAVSR